MRYTNAVYKTADSSTTLQMSNRVIVEHSEQMGCEHPEQLDRVIVITSRTVGIFQIKWT
ncbi:MAG: hypothetical protein IPN26_07975 [Bacteroidetes bacterium]|nr:hypothetical protein [Bacteroidota bacterium]